MGFRAYNPRHQNQKKVAEKVREIPVRILTGVCRPRDIECESNNYNVVSDPTEKMESSNRKLCTDNPEL